MPNVEYRLVHVQQSTSMTCWAAAASMILGWTPDTRDIRTAGPPEYGLDASDGNLRAFAQKCGFMMHYPQTWTAAQMFEALRGYGPLWVAGRWRGNLDHAVVVAGIRGTLGAASTDVLIYDSANRRGAFWGRFMMPAIKAPLWTCYVMHRAWR